MMAGSAINTDEQITLRRACSNLRNAGGGFIVFGIWSVIKLFMMATMQEGNIAKLNDMPGVERSVLLAIQITLFLIAALAVMGIHLWIGLGAIRYALGKSHKRSHFILAICGIVFTIAQLPFYFYDPAKDAMLPFDETTIASVVVDITVVFIFLDMIVSTIRMDRLNRSISTDVSVSDTVTDKG